MCRHIERRAIQEAILFYSDFSVPTEPQDRSYPEEDLAGELALAQVRCADDEHDRPSAERAAKAVDEVLRLGKSIERHFLGSITLYTYPAILKSLQCTIQEDMVYAATEVYIVVSLLLHWGRFLQRPLLACH